MQKQKIIVISVLTFVLVLSSFAALANATGTQYKLEFGCPGGIDVPKGDKQCVIATTTNQQVTAVRFKWWDPWGHKDRDVTVPTNGSGIFEDCFNPNDLGWWEVTAIFIKTGDDVCKSLDFKVTCNKYDLVCDPPCGSSVQLGILATATANTTNKDIDYVNFTWFAPNGQKVTVKVSVTKYYTPWPQHNYKYSLAVSTKVLDQMGGWSIKAEFVDSDYSTYISCHDVHKSIAWRCQRLHVIPEVPMLGTIGASVAMIAGLALKTKLKRKR